MPAGWFRQAILIRAYNKAVIIPYYLHIQVIDTTKVVKFKLCYY